MTVRYRSGGGSAGAPAGGSAGALITDAMGPIKLVCNDSNATLTENTSYTVRATYADTNTSPTDTAAIKLALNDSNTVPTDSSTLQTVFLATSTWTAPAGITSVTVECWGGGGGGGKGGTLGTANGGGGSGGGYARSILAVTPSTSYTVTVGAAVAGQVNGNPSWFNTSGTIFGSGGNRGGDGAALPGGGSAPNTNIGTVTFSGGSGAAGAIASVGGGGGGAGSTANGGNAVTNNGGAGGAIGGGAGGTLSNGAGTAAGGAGAGGPGSPTSPGPGGTGARGEVRIKWTAA